MKRQYSKVVYQDNKTEKVVTGYVTDGELEGKIKVEVEGWGELWLLSASVVRLLPRQPPHKADQERAPEDKTQPLVITNGGGT